MVGLVIVSHSEQLAIGVKELTSQMSGDVPIQAAGGTKDGRIGTDIDKIISAIREVYSNDGVIVLFDLGSAYMNAEMSLDFLEDGMIENVSIVDAAMVEGAVTAGIQSSMGKTLFEIKNELKELRIGKMPE